MAISFISKNQHKIEKETEEFSLTKNKQNNRNNNALKDYCCTKLLEISPIHVFFQSISLLFLPFLQQTFLYSNNYL